MVYGMVKDTVILCMYVFKSSGSILVSNLLIPFFLHQISFGKNF